jgi:hypothetical protein
LGEERSATMTDDQERIRRGVDRTGLTEAELQVFDSLVALGEAWFELPNRSLRDNAMFASGYDSIANLLAMRVVKRDHPEGWRTRRDELEVSEEGDTAP